jgi:3-deoxy-D-manno-octulosonate 8-phosphate phosphatase (KDO 8-P phosphatase)
VPDVKGLALADSTDIRTRAARVRLLLFDVDGVLTDGTILLHADGSESKRFHIRDGTAIVWAHRAGLRTGLLSGRASLATTQRATQLGIAVVRQDVIAKEQGYDAILEELGLSDAEVAYMGDDLLDLPVLRRAGLSGAPSDAVPEVLSRVHWTSGAAGGSGAVREFVEFILRAQGRWDGLVAQYSGEATA